MERRSVPTIFTEGTKQAPLSVLPPRKPPLKRNYQEDEYQNCLQQVKMWLWTKIFLTSVQEMRWIDSSLLRTKMVVSFSSTSHRWISSRSWIHSDRYNESSCPFAVQWTFCSPALQNLFSYMWNRIWAKSKHIQANPSKWEDKLAEITKFVEIA